MVHYIGYMIDDDNESKYSYNVPGNKKMKYVLSSIGLSGFDACVFSLCRKKDKGFIKTQKKILGENQFIQYRSSSSGNVLLRLLDKVLLKWELTKYILFKVKKTDTVVLYHSVRATHIVSKIMKYKKADFILEVEELYGYGATHDDPNVDKEISDIKKFSKFIFVNDTLPTFLGIKDNYTVCYGVYDIKQIPQKTGSDKIKVVYAGTIENHKVGAYTAVEAAKYLPENYELHIAGFGNKEAIDKLQTMLEENNKQNQCKIFYHGKLDGDDLSNLLFSCEIGLSTYVIRLPFSNCVFPSKLTTYVCHGLKVVIGRSENFEKAAISQGWIYYDDNEPKTIAASIIKASKSETKDFCYLIRDLDLHFKNWLKENINGR